MWENECTVENNISPTRLKSDDWAATVHVAMFVVIWLVPINHGSSSQLIVVLIVRNVLKMYITRQ